MSGARRGAAVVKQKWTAEEEAALRAGVEKYDVGKWRNIQKDEVFGPVLKSRSNVDLKDKWRNLNMDAGGHRRDNRGSSERSGRRKKRRRADSSEPDLEGDEEYVVRRSYATGRRRSARKAPLKDRSPSPPPPPQPPDVTAEIILAAMIQLQDPAGYSEDALLQWLQENYEIGPEQGAEVGALLDDLIEEGKIMVVRGLYKLSGFPQQLMEESRRFAGADETGGAFNRAVISNREAREAAEAAAKAVQEAEEAAALAAELIAAADKFQEEADQEGHRSDEGQ